MLNNWLDELIQLEKSPECSLTLILTQRCNLRCQFCNIHEWLTTKTEQIYEIQKLLDFIEILNKQIFNIHLIGGEVFTCTDRLKLFITELNAHKLSITTNLVSIPENIEFLRPISIRVSLDGLPDRHNSIRGAETFQKTYRNLAKLIQDGFDITVQSILPESYYHSQDLKKFFGMLAYIGLSPDKIKCNIEVPWNVNKQTDHFFIQSLSKNAPYKQPCCSYRFMSNFVVTPDAKLWNGYYNVLQNQFCLGNLDSSLEEIRNNYLNCLHRSHFAKDPVCPTCPALKQCWGLYCASTYKYNDKLHPSDLCDQQAIISKIK